VYKRPEGGVYELQRVGRQLAIRTSSFGGGGGGGGRGGFANVFYFPLCLSNLCGGWQFVVVLGSRDFFFFCRASEREKK
jgi:hypothetical protein